MGDGMSDEIQNRRETPLRASRGRTRVRYLMLAAALACVPLAIAQPGGTTEPASAALMPAPPAAVGGHRLLLDRDLNARVVEVTGISKDAIAYIDETGLIRSEPISEHIALLPAPPEAGTEPAFVIDTPVISLSNADDSTITTTDRQRIVGTLDAQEGQTVVWQHSKLGSISLPLDRVATLVLRGLRQNLPASEADDAGDVVHLANGDRLVGYVDHVAPTVAVEVSGSTRELTHDTVFGVRFANPSVAPRGAMVHLGDGTRVAIKSITIDASGRLAIVPMDEATQGPQPRAALAWDDVTAIVFDASRVVPLASIRPTKLEALGGRAWTRPMRVLDGLTDISDAPAIELPGPMAVTWALPKGATRVGFQAELPPGQWSWGDCDLVVLAGEREIARATLSPRQASASVNAAIPPSGAAGTLTIRLESGRHGPIQDRVVISRALVVTR